METVTLELTDIANGGDALGRDENGRVIFVPFTLPGERVEVAIEKDKGRFAHGRLLTLLEAAPERIEPRCPHFGVCGGCHWQHTTYQQQLSFKQSIVRDQLARIGQIEDAPVRATLPNPEPWRYSMDVTFSPTEAGGLGFWSPQLQEVMDIEVCYLIRPILEELFQDIDAAFPGLRRATLRVGDDDALLLALEVTGLEPPELSTDFPVSVSVVLPDGTAANLVGDNYIIRRVRERDFRVSAGSFFYPSPAATLLVDTVLRLAAVQDGDMAIDAYAGVGMLTAFLAEQAAEVAAVEAAPDAVEDFAANLQDLDNVSLYHGLVEEALPALGVIPEVLVVDPPPEGLSREMVAIIAAMQPDRFIYTGGDVATFARDSRQLVQAGFHLLEVQPIDMLPQTYHALTVSLWQP
ncbi:MAG: TRAM domain-containing protein [Anaerolineae bacterium]|nr:TRAM domain-containing protein [Anaerolineae bacterium]